MLSGENFGKYLKVGVVEDEDMKEELAKLCRFFSKNHGEDFVSFDEYIKDMKVGEAAEEVAFPPPRIRILRRTSTQQLRCPFLFGLI